MKYQIYTIFDNVAKLYHPPMFLMNDAVAIRNITTLKNDPSTSLGQNPNDFNMYHIGEYDDLMGEISVSTKTQINSNVQLKEVSEK